MTAKIQPPSREWLEKEWLLPPKGKGRGSPGIATELGVDKSTVLKWLKDYGIREDGNRRNSVHRKGKQTWSKERPPKDELADLYLMPPDGQGKTQKEVAEHYQVSALTVHRWLKHYGLVQAFSYRHSLRMAGEGNAAYNGGKSRNYHKNVLVRSGKPKRCLWCKTTENLQVHHKDHDVTNGSPDNLEWLCYACNHLEAGLWLLSSRTSHEILEEDGVITELRIRFTRRQQVNGIH